MNSKRALSAILSGFCVLMSNCNAGAHYYGIKEKLADYAEIQKVGVSLYEFTEDKLNTPFPYEVVNCNENELGRYATGNIFLKCSNKKCALGKDEKLIHMLNESRDSYLGVVMMRAREGKYPFCCPCCGEKIKSSNVYASDIETQKQLRSLDSLGFKAAKFWNTIKNNPLKTAGAVFGTMFFIGAIKGVVKLNKENKELKKELYEKKRPQSITTLEGSFKTNDLGEPKMRGTFRQISYN